MAMTTLSPGQVTRRPMADINIIPLVDVVLVLLIIFMVTAPFLQGGLDLELPKVSSTGLDLTEGLVIDVLPGGEVRIEDRMIPLDDLGAALADAGATARPVFLRADARVPYGDVARVLGRAREAGVTNLGLVTEPEPASERRRPR